MPTYMNAVNEVLVEAFLQEKISWKEIPQFLEELMQKHNRRTVSSLEDYLEIDFQARKDAEEAYLLINN